MRVASVGVVHHQLGRSETATPTVDHAAVLDVLCEAGLIAPGRMIEPPRVEP